MKFHDQLQLVGPAMSCQHAFVRTGCIFRGRRGVRRLFRQQLNAAPHETHFFSLAYHLLKAESSPPEIFSLFFISLLDIQFSKSTDISSQLQSIAFSELSVCPVTSQPKCPIHKPPSHEKASQNPATQSTVHQKQDHPPPPPNN
jgi:hypothetical protein